MLFMIMIMSLSPLLIFFYTSFGALYMTFFMVDQMSMCLLILAAFSILWGLVAERYNAMHKENWSFFLISLFLLFIALFLAFFSKSWLSFYIFFESSLIPTAMLILRWGYQPERLLASYFFFLYTVGASLPFLFFILFHSHPSFSLISMFPLNLKTSWFLIVSAMFAKLPLFGFHLWLPKAHVEASTAGSILLAAILLKLSSLGSFRLLQLSPSSFNFTGGVLLSFSLMGAFLSALMCTQQKDFKSLIAYSSVTHMGMMMSILFLPLPLPYMNILFISLAHGLTSAGLFFLAGGVFSQTLSRNVLLLKALSTLSPMISYLWAINLAYNMSCPPSFNFMGEVMTLSSVLFISFFTAPLLILVLFVTGVYNILLYISLSHYRPLSLSMVFAPSLFFPLLMSSIMSFFFFLPPF